MKILLYKWSKNKTILCRYFLLVFILVFPILLCIIYAKTVIFSLIIVLGMHLFISVPMIYYLRKKWNIMESLEKNNYEVSLTFYSWILIIAVGIIYPLFWIVLLSLLRYLRLGSSIDITVYLDHILFLCCIVPFIFYELKTLYNLIKNIQSFLWSYTEFMFFKIHLYWLQYYDYFRIFQLMHKSHFIIFDFFFQYPGAYYRCFDERVRKPIIVRMTKIIQYLYYHPYILYSSIVLSIILELILFKGIVFYNLYIVFWYTIIMSCLRLYHIIGFQDIVKNMCMSDYVYANFLQPRYHLKFWFFAKNPILWYNFSYTLENTTQEIYLKTISLEETVYAQFTKFHTELPYRIHGYKRKKTSVGKTIYPRTYGIKRGVPYSWTIRIAANYKVQHGVRWFHTTRPAYGPEKNLLHPFTAKFLKDPYAILALLNKPGQSFAKLQQLSKDIHTWPKPEELYGSYHNIFLDQHKTLTDILESNFVMRFKFLAEQEISIGTFKSMKKKYGYDNLETMQMRPDLVSLWINNKIFQFKGYLAIDEKHKIISATNNGRHQAINNIDYNEYIALLKDYETNLIKRQKHTEEIRVAIEELKDIDGTDKSISSSRHS